MGEILGKRGQRRNRAVYLCGVVSRLPGQVFRHCQACRVDVDDSSAAGRREGIGKRRDERR